MKNMKLMAMQPYFLPYLGYFSLIKHTDLVVISDSLQFIHKGFINRNRILKPRPNDGFCYIHIPLCKFPHTAKINEVYIDSSKAWKESIFGQFSAYKKAPYYKQSLEVLNEILAFSTNRLDEFVLHSIKIICEYLGIPYHIVLLSHLNVESKRVNAADEWALETCKILGFSNYCNPYNGITFYDVAKYNANGIKIYFQKFNSAIYNQKRENFIENLSIIDVMAFNSIDDIHLFLDNFEWIDNNKIITTSPFSIIYGGGVYLLSRSTRIKDSTQRSVA